MPESTTMTIRIDPAVKADLDLLASYTKRSKSYLASEAISGFVAHELKIAEGIRRGLADIEAGRVIPHEEAMARIRATIDRVKAEKRAAGL